MLAAAQAVLSALLDVNRWLLDLWSSAFDAEVSVRTLNHVMDPSQGT